LIDVFDLDQVCRDLCACRVALCWHCSIVRLILIASLGGELVMGNLDGRVGLILGMANQHSIAFGCAKACREAGAELAVSYQSERSLPFLQPCMASLPGARLWPCDVRIPGQLEQLFERVGQAWGTLDFLVHSIAYATREDLHTGLLNSSAEGFALAMDVSCHSFIRAARLAAPLMHDGGCLVTVTFYGAEKAVEHYNLMGPVKAALECSVRYLALELGGRGIRVHAVSPGPMKTRAASGLDRFDELLERARQRVPLHMLADIDDVGRLIAFLVSPAAKCMTGNIEHVDAGYHIMG
jgi:enoyl-[acyl-carrier protein] reductase I